MVDAVYRGNIEELFSVLNHLKKYIVIFVFVLLVLISILHFSKYSVQVLPLITVTVVLFSAVYYTTVLVLKFVNGITSNQTVSTYNIAKGMALKHSRGIQYLFYIFSLWRMCVHRLNMLFGTYLILNVYQEICNLFERKKQRKYKNSNF